MPASFIDSPRMRRTYSPWSPPATGGTSTYSSMFSSARIGWPAATAPTSGRPVGRTSDRTLSTASSTVLATAVDALSSSSSARGLDGSRRSRPSFSRLARCACTVDDEARPTALPMSRTVGGYPCLAEYRLMKSKISCWRLVRSTGSPFAARVTIEHVFVTVARPLDGCKRRVAAATCSLCSFGCPRAGGGIGRRARLRALWGNCPVEVRVLFGACEKAPHIGGLSSLRLATSLLRPSREVRVPPFRPTNVGLDRGG